MSTRPSRPPRRNASQQPIPAAGRCSLKCHTLRGKCHTLRGNERQGVDKAGVAFFHYQRSGAPVALTGLKGNPVSNPELPPQLSAASPSPGCHWALHGKAREGGEGSRPASQETCLNDVILPACGACAWGGLPLW